MIATTEYQAPLKDYRLFVSASIDEAREFVGNVFCPHRLTPSKRTVQLKAQMNHARISDYTSLNFLKYGAKVNVEPGALQDFFNVQIQLTGNVVTRCGSQTEDIGVGDAAVLSPTEYVSMDWNSDSSMLIYRIDKKLVERKLTAMICDSLSDPIVFAAKLNHHSASGAGWLRAVRFLLDELDGGAKFLNFPHAAEAFDDSLVMSLLFGQEHNYSHRLHNGPPKATPRSVERVEEYIQENAGNAISIEDLTRVSQSSARSLYSAFRYYRETSPMKYLRKVRLENVRQDLLDGSREVSVTAVAIRWQFFQLGRFAAEYQQAFGELPSSTLRRVR